MSARVEHTKWAVILLTHENPPSGLRLEDERRIDVDQLDLDLALGAFSRGGIDDSLTAVEAVVWLSDRRAINPLIRGPHDPSWHVRRAAARGLAGYRPLPDWTLEPRGAATGDSEPSVRAEVARALGHLCSVALAWIHRVVGRFCPGGLFK
jgi:HEAT repeat protein